MLENSKLLEFNPHLGPLNGLFQDSRDRFRTSNVDHGLQHSISEIYTNSDDLSLYSLQIEQGLHTNELRAALSPAPFNFLSSIDFTKVKNTLDLNEDFGGVTHYLAEHVEQVDAVRLDVGKGHLTAVRTNSKDNVCLISEDLGNLKWPLNHYDLIVVGAIERLGLERDQRISLISRLKAALTENGTLILGSPNSESPRIWLDSKPCQGESEVPYLRLYDFDLSGNNLADLQTDFETAGFSHISRYASFSKHEDVSNLFSEEYLGKNVPNANDSVLNHFYRLGAISNAQVSEYALFRKSAAVKSNLLVSGSRFLVLASESKSELDTRLNIDFAHYSGTGRQAHWRCTTYKAAGSNAVIKRPVYPDIQAATQIPQLSQNLNEQSYQHGKLLVVDWIDTALEGDANAFSKLVSEYSDFLDRLLQDRGEQEFRKIAYDMLPFNLIAPSSGNSKKVSRNFEIIDPEWQLNKSFGPEFVLFRALFWFAFENKSVLQKLCADTNIITLGMFIEHWMPETTNTQDIETYVTLEEQTQALIDGSFRAGAVANALVQTFSNAEHNPTKSSTDPVCQIQWGDSSGTMDESRAKFANWDARGAKLCIDLPPFSTKKPVLRIDPMNSKGIFELSELKILDTEGNELLGLNSAHACLSFANQVNVQVLNNGKSCIALTEDPHFLFNLETVQGLENAKQCTLKLARLSDDDSQSALDELSLTLDHRNNQIHSQKNKLNEYRSKLEFLTKRIEQERERGDLLSRIAAEIKAEGIKKVLELEDTHHEQLSDRAMYTNLLIRRFTNLNDQFTHQVNHNRTVDHYLMQRTSTRLKRMLSRIVNRLLGRGTPIPETAPEAEPEALAPDQLEAQSSTLGTDQMSLPAENEEQPAEQNEVVQVEKELLGQNLEDYDLWVEQNNMTADEIKAAKKAIDGFDTKPVFSILVPIYNTDPDYLLPMIRSVQEQIYPHWQLCLVDDCSPRKWLRTILEIEAAKDDRIALQFNEKNQGIALTSNDALALATGDYIALLDHDDELSIDALYENAKLINERPDAGLIYSDEDKMDMQGNRLEPFFKPDYSPDLLDTNNYVCHFTVMKKAIVDRIGGFRESFDGSQDHDIILRAIEESSYVAHIPKILYHWRKIPGSTAVEYDSKSYAWEAGRRAVEECAQRHDKSVRVEYGSLKGTYRVYRNIRNDPLVSIVIPFKDKPELLLDCVGAILQQTSYQNYEVVGVSNNSEQAETQAAMEKLLSQDSRVRFIEKNVPFNFSAICNYGVENAKGEYVLLLNNDVTVENKDWLERLLEHAQQPNIGAVGGKLLFPDGRIQHAGIVAGMVGAAGHPHKFFPDQHIGYHGRLHMVYNVSAVTGAMLMVNKDKYLEVGGLDEENLAVAYNDVDFCLKLLERGYRNLFTPHCRAIHHESVSRGYEDTDEKMARLLKEQSHFLQRWKEFLAKGDPYYNPNLSLKNEYFSLKFEEERLAEEQ